MNRKTLDSRDFTKPAKTTREPLAALISARAVSAALSMREDLGALWEVERKDWVPCL